MADKKVIGWKVRNHKYIEIYEFPQETEGVDKGVDR